MKIFVCRCEDVSLEDVRDVLADGFVTVEEVKRMTGLGTGPCQGKDCMAACALLCRAAASSDSDDTRPFTARPPLTPVPLGALAAWGDDH
jgi:sarcosine oxidase subunit beta